jgi:hypothetical protein
MVHMDILTAVSILGLVITIWRVALRFSRVTTGAVGVVAKTLLSGRDDDTAQSNVERLESKMLEAADGRNAVHVQTAVNVISPSAPNPSRASFGKRG